MGEKRLHVLAQATTRGPERYDRYYEDVETGVSTLEPPGWADVASVEPAGKEPAMKTLISLALAGMLSLVLAAPVLADRGGGSGSRGGQGGTHGEGFPPGGGVRDRLGPHHHYGAPLHDGWQHGRNFHRGCCWGGAFVGWPARTTVVTVPSYPVHAAAVYVPAPAYQPPVHLAPPVESEICYTGGCYRLQGDGVSAPFQWVWIPTVPEPPPAPPTAPPATTAAPGGPAPADAGPPRPRSQLYRWVDDQGVANWTNNREAVPERYRAQLKPAL